MLSTKELLEKYNIELSETMKSIEEETISMPEQPEFVPRRYM